MYLVTVLVVGLIIGALEKAVLSGPTTGGGLETMLLGVSGAVLGGMAARAYGWFQTPIHPAGVVASIAGAMLILLVNRLLSQSRRTS
jgi:uncharacterized membrane protein YeaQ/YmgE (transglycosylase-associated protein family)